jgi:hypothetical protein
LGVAPFPPFTGGAFGTAGAPFGGTGLIGPFAGAPLEGALFAGGFATTFAGAVFGAAAAGRGAEANKMRLAAK